MACGSLERQARDPTNLGFLCSCLACFSPTDLQNFCWSPFSSPLPRLVKYLGQHLPIIVPRASGTGGLSLYSPDGQSLTHVTLAVGLAPSSPFPTSCTSRRCADTLWLPPPPAHGPLSSLPG